jgi:hypothetical protein
VLFAEELILALGNVRYEKSYDSVYGRSMYGGGYYTGRSVRKSYGLDDDWEGYDDDVYSKYWTKSNAKSETVKKPLVLPNVTTVKKGEGSIAHPNYKEGFAASHGGSDCILNAIDFTAFNGRALQLAMDSLNITWDNMYKYSKSSMMAQDLAEEYAWLQYGKENSGRLFKETILL